MLKSLYFLCLLLICAFVSKAQIDLKNSVEDLRSQLKKANQISSKIQLSLELSNFYLYNKTHDKKNRDSALYFAKSAENLAQSINDQSRVENAEILIANYLIRTKKPSLIEGIISSLRRPARSRLMILLGQYYILKPGSYKSDFDSAQHCFDESRKYAPNFHYRNLSDIKLGSLYFERGDTLNWKKTLLRVIRDSKIGDDKDAQARAIAGLADNSPQDEALKYYKEAIYIFAQLGKKEEQVDILKLIADIHLQQGKLILSEQELNKVIQLYKNIKYKNLQYTYNLLSGVNRLKGNLDKALFYALETVRIMDNTGTDEASCYFYRTLADVYQDLGQSAESIKWNRKAILAFQKYNVFPYTVFKNITDELIKQGKAEEALKEVSKSKLSNDLSKILRPLIFGSCYQALKKYDLAESYYLSAVSILDASHNKDYYYAETYYAIGNFYINQHKFDKADFYLSKVLALPYGIYSAAKVSDIHQLLFQIDSAKGNYTLAIAHYKISKSIHDSIFNASKSQQIQELEFKYNLSEKNHDNQLLRDQSKFQQIQIQKGILTKKLTLWVLIVLLIIIGLLYYAYQVKQNSNRKLKIQQNGINDRNIKLLKLVDEKEWLIKEIHHRVKNNLQVIMSLLNTQSMYLNNTDALAAIRDSQNRLHSISLIHQKLYQSDHVDFIDIKTYIIELVKYLGETFGKTQWIKFHFQIPTLSININQAVSLGLILNEAITNIMKYAYTDGKPGNVNISIYLEKEQFYVLSIQDDGKGLPDDFDLSSNGSLGMVLMQGLSEQLEGSFKIKSVQGVTLEIKFNLMPVIGVNPILNS